MSKKIWSKEEMKLIALEMIRSDKSIRQLCKEYGISEASAYKWKNKALEALDNAFTKNNSKNNNFEAERSRLQRIIGEQACVIDTLKKISQRS